ncbi:MAG: thioesterase family protein [Deltaproteobacteria bacterium]|nr:thioesterase family protein [Deltaproteobacteria bacterium]
MPFDIRDFETLMALDDEDGDVFVGRSPAYPWGRVYGGQVVAQALRAATNTVPADRFVHSLHVYFIRGGDSDLPIRYAVERVRDGGSFSLRNVVASQSKATMMQMTASFQVDESATEADVQEGALRGGLPDPEALADASWGPILERRLVEMKDARAAYWMRIAGMRTLDPAMQACALAFASDDVPTEAANQSHPLRASFINTSSAYDSEFVGASLDHAIWFHRRGRYDEWVLHDFQGAGIAGARGLGVGRIFSREGVHLATVAQEILIRKRR